MTYRVREVDGSDDGVSEDLQYLHYLTFASSAEVPEFDNGHWWLVYVDGISQPIGFAGVVQVASGEPTGYLKRSGVLSAHRGHGLQKRLISVRERRAKRNGWGRVITDTTDNIHSANNMIGAGYRLFNPHTPWAFDNSLYWYKDLT